MKLHISYLFERDTHTLVKQFDSGKTSTFGGHTSARAHADKWLKEIKELGFFEATTEKGLTLVPIRNINFIKLEE